MNDATHRLLRAALLLSIATSARAQEAAPCPPPFTHVVRLTIDATGIETKTTVGPQMVASSVRDRMVRKLAAAGIEVVNEDGQTKTEVPPENSGDIRLKLTGKAWLVPYREVSSGASGEIVDFYMGISLQGTMTVAIGNTAHSDDFESNGDDWSIRGMLPASADDAPFDCAVFESPQFLKLLFKRLDSLVGRTNASRAVIDGYRTTNGYAKIETLNKVHDVLKEMRPDATSWLFRELKEPCHPIRQRVVNIVPPDFYEQMFQAQPPEELRKIASACNDSAGGDRDIIPDVMVTMTTAEEPIDRGKAAKRMIDITMRRLQKGDREALADLKTARDQARGQEREMIEKALAELDPFYQRPAFIAGAIGIVILIGIGAIAINLFGKSTQQSAQTSPQKPAAPARNVKRVHHCPNCNHELAYLDQHAGKEALCPKCQQRTRLPD